MSKDIIEKMTNELKENIIAIREEAERDIKNSNQIEIVIVSTETDMFNYKINDIRSFKTAPLFFGNGETKENIFKSLDISGEDIALEAISLLGSKFEMVSIFIREIESKVDIKDKYYIKYKNIDKMHEDIFNIIKDLVIPTNSTLRYNEKEKSVLIKKEHMEYIGEGEYKLIESLLIVNNISDMLIFGKE